MFASRILLLAAHPDDEVVGCCAAIGRARTQGASIGILFLTTGIPAREHLWPWERSRYSDYIERRRVETRQSCAQLGAEIAAFSDVPSRELVKNVTQTRKLVLEHLGATNSAVTWVPAYEGGHPDHDIASFIGTTLRAEAEVWEYSEYNFFAGETHSNEFLAPNGAELKLWLSPEERLAKTNGLAIYASERRNLNYVRTEQEVFRPLAEYDYAKPPHPGTLFYRRYAWASFHPKVNHVRPQQLCAAMAEFRIDR
jgi:LmbE family N-acetylglucosaminyl deacetylase